MGKTKLHKEIPALKGKQTNKRVPHLGGAESKSPHRSVEAVELEFDGATEFELFESKSSKQPV